MNVLKVIDPGKTASTVCVAWVKTYLLVVELSADQMSMTTLMIPPVFRQWTIILLRLPQYNALQRCVNPFLPEHCSYSNTSGHSLDQSQPMQTAQPDMGQNCYRSIFCQRIILLNPLPDDKILDWSKLKQITDDIPKCI